MKRLTILLPPTPLSFHPSLVANLAQDAVYSVSSRASATAAAAAAATPSS